MMQTKVLRVLCEGRQKTKGKLPAECWDFQLLWGWDSLLNINRQEMTRRPFKWLVGFKRDDAGQVYGIYSALFFKIPIKTHRYNDSDGIG